MSEPKIKTKQFIYRNSLRWLDQRRGLLSCPDKPDIKIATPPEFKGHSGIWTPEELFVASVNTCIMTTFLHFADKQGLKFLRYESDAEGILEKAEDKFTPPLRAGAGFMFSKIIVKPKILVNSNNEVEKAKNLIELSSQHCLISNSIKSEVILEANIGARDGVRDGQL